MLGSTSIMLTLLAALAGDMTLLEVASLEDADCVRCHEVVARQWEASQHRTSFSDASFQAAFNREPRPFCRNCHAPLEPSEVTASSGAVGIGCVSCHVRDDAVLATRPIEHAPHAVLPDPKLGEARACDGCHQFEFPDGFLRDRPALMQSTLDEHARSRFSQRSCADCHMPIEDGKRSHRFRASRDPEILRRSVEIDAVRTGPGAFTVTLRAAKVGHAVPTGDLLRRLEVGVAVVGEEERSARRYLARHFGPKSQASGIMLESQLRDDRVPADGSPRVVELRLPRSDGLPVRWWVTHQRVAHQRSPDEGDAKLDGEVVLATGVFGQESDP